MQASRKLQRLLPNFASASDGPQEEGQQLDLSNDEINSISNKDIRIKSALSLPMMPQGDYDAAGRLVYSPGMEPSMHNHSSTGMLHRILSSCSKPSTSDQTSFLSKEPCKVVTLCIMSTHRLI